jgi:hypothetical protein
MTEATKRQDALSTVFTRNGQEELSPTADVTYDTIREIVKDPTVSIARNFSVAPILISDWSVQTKEEELPKIEEAKKFIEKQVLPWRLRFLEKALYNAIDYGWAPFEIVYEEVDGKIGIKKIKPLLHDITAILVDASTGEFVGFQQNDDSVVDEEKSLLVSINVEGTMWYGRGFIEGVYEAYTAWNDANDGAKRYDKKIAGSHFVVFYPPGDCLNEDGETLTNAEMAGTVLDSLESSGSISIPTTILEHLQQLNMAQASQYEWKIEILEDKGGRQPTFIERLKYLDALKSRGLNMPERTLMEGTHGTKAESSEHGSAAITFMDFLHLYVTEILNRMVVDRLLIMNFGPEYAGEVCIIPAPLVDERQIYLEKVYLALLSRMKDASEIQNIDLWTLKDLVKVPKASKEVKFTEEEDKTELPGAGGEANEENVEEEENEEDRKD